MQLKCSCILGEAMVGVLRTRDRSFTGFVTSKTREQSVVERAF